ncbi:hypothetical protein [Nocardia sp. NPDC052566]|uniref:hypothetical protein n=1 Tax=Nocardia sp. NPDC052566 TaxID=3364330 RepID=UPI0037C7CE2D
MGAWLGGTVVVDATGIPKLGTPPTGLPDAAAIENPNVIAAQTIPIPAAHFAARFA